MKFDIEKINEQLNTEDVKKVLYSLNSDVFKEDEEQIIFYSACHNKEPYDPSHKAKLYYYKNSKTFTCYVCSESFDIYDLVKKNKALFNCLFCIPNTI